MRKLRKLVLTTAALAALAVGGAAFAQAQSAGTAVQATVQQPKGETSAPGDTDGVQSGDQSESEQGHHDESGSDAAAHESEAD